MAEIFKQHLDVNLGDAYLPDVEYCSLGDLPSRYAVSDLAAESIARAGSWLLRYRNGLKAHENQLQVDRVLASRWFAWSLRPVGWQTPSAWDAIAGDYRCADGWIRLHTNAPEHRRAALQVLDLAERSDRLAVAERVVGWTGASLEAAVVDCGGCAAQLRRPEQWAAHVQGQAVAAEPLVSEQVVECPGAGDALVDLARPLAGIRVLDLTRVLAGPVAGRFLAAYGADVLRIDPPHWEEPAVVPEVTLGKRCAGLDLRSAADREVFTALLRDCDVLLHGYRPGALQGLGFDAQWRRRINPRLLDISLSAYGSTGPWAKRRGFDSLVQMSTGIAWPAEMEGQPSPLPVQALDHATGYLMAAAALKALCFRREQGLASESRLSLAGTAALLGSVQPAAKIHTMPAEQAADISRIEEQTAWGLAHRLRFPVGIKGSEARWLFAAGPLRRHLPCW